MTIRAPVLAVAIVASACGGPSSPTSTTESPGGGVPFQATRYMIDIIGGSSQCGDVQNPQAGTYVTVFVQLRPDASGWTATADNSGTGSISLRFQRGSGSVSSPSEMTLAGSATGFGDDEGFLTPTGQRPSGTRISFEGSVPLNGTLSTAGGFSFAHGQFNGSVVFSRNGVTARCPAGAVGWTMNRF